MALLEMKKIRVIAHGKESSEILEVMQKLGTVELIDVSETYPEYNLQKREKVAFEFNYVSSRLDFAVEFLSKFQKQNFLKKALEGTREPVSQDEVNKIANTFYFNDLIEKVSDIESQISDTKQRIQKLEEEEEILSEWSNLEIPLGVRLQTETTESIFIRIKGNDKDNLISKISEAQIASNLFPVSDTNFVFTFFKSDKEPVLSLLSESGAEIIDLPKRRGTPAEELERIGRAKRKALKEIDFALKEAEKISKEHLPKLKILSDHFYWKKQKDDILTSAVGTENISIFEGWCPTIKLQKLKDELSKATTLFAIEEIELKEDENPPVEIENKGIFKPFETITRLYGMPGHKDIDPTAFLASFFFIFFGLCLTDVIYGIVVFALFALILLLYKIPKETKPLFTLLMLGGLSSIIVGFFFGGYAGIDVKLLPEWMRKFQLFDPIASPLNVFYLSLSMGVLQVMAGIAVKIIVEAKNKNLIGGILDSGPWLFLFSGMILFIGSKFGVWESLPLFNYIIYASLGAIILTAGRKEKNIFKKGVMGVLGLYGSVGYFSDILSYSRLLALGLATSALAFSINLIALLAKDLIPYVGLILMVIILIIGHLFNLVINILGAFIHSARLQFVEFFGKFLAGSGRGFKPFRQEERNVVIIK